MVFSRSIGIMALMAADDHGLDWSLSEEDELFLMANLHPSETGVPMTVWVSPKAEARHDARVKVSAVRGGRMQLRGAPVISIRPEPRLLYGEMDPADLRQVSDWIRLNEAVLIDYWHEVATTSDLVQRLQRLPG